MRFRRPPLTTQLTSLVIITTLSTLLLVVFLMFSRAQRIVEDAIVARSAQLLETTARQLADPISRNNTLSAFTILSPIPSAGSIRRVTVYNDQSVFVAQVLSKDIRSADRSGDAPLVQQTLASGQISEQRSPGLILLIAPVIGRDRSIGAVVMELPTDDIEEQWAILRQDALIIGAVLIALMALAALLIARYTVHPIKALTTAAGAFGRGNFTAPLDTQRGDELGQLALAFQRMAENIQGSQAQIETQNQILEIRASEQEKALTALQDAMRTQAELSDTIRQLSIPIMPVWEGVLVMPLIGNIDGKRAELLVSTLLAIVESQRADFVIIDLTGVPLVDTLVAKILLQAASAVKLLGAEIIMVGLRPELAHTIVSLGLDLSSLLTHADLQSGIIYATEQVQRRVALRV